MPSDEEILGQLTQIERKVLPELLKTGNASEIIKLTGLKDVEVLRAFQWLTNKELITVDKQETDVIILEKNGQIYKKEGLPEKKFLNAIKKGKKTLEELTRILDREEINACIGILKRQAAINTEAGPSFSITEQGFALLKKETLEEKYLEQEFPITEKNMPPEFIKVTQDFLKRKNLIRKDKQIEWTAILTPKGKLLAQKTGNSETYEEKLTPEMLKTGSWKNKKFRAYDVNSRVPSIMRGRKHFVNEAVEYIKQIWLELGFEEMEGDKVQSAFWDLDTLFVPQDHPAREMQDTFYIDGNAKLPEPLLKKVSKVHQDGADTGSKGWQTKYSKEEAQKILLRTHTTVISAHTLSNLKKTDLPKKFFIVGRVYRNEALDWKHLFEFNQVEGIVVDPNGNLAQLKGYLKEFFSKMGYTDVRIRPGHFPYTEPSAEIEAYNPEKKQWVEMGGCGIFRPEVTKTLLGFECPILAWGLGMERIISTYYEITDIRDLYKNDLQQLKTMKAFMK